MFEPPDLSVDYRDAITWVSQDSEVHKIISGDPLTLQPNHIFSTSFIPPGKSFSIQLGPLVSDTLEIDYYCQLHPWETGRLLIKKVTLRGPEESSIFGELHGYSGKLGSKI